MKTAEQSHIGDCSWVWICAKHVVVHHPAMMKNKREGGGGGAKRSAVGLQQYNKAVLYRFIEKASFNKKTLMEFRLGLGSQN